MARDETGGQQRRPSCDPMANSKKPRPTKPTLDPKRAQQIAVSAARQALAEYACDPAHMDAMVTSALNKGLPSALATTLETLGIDTTDPEALRKDMAHLRESRTFLEM